MTRQDLAAYRPVWRRPTKIRYRGHTVLGMPAPSSGGLATAEILNIIEGFDLRKAGRSSADQIHLLAEAEKIAWADRNAYVGDPSLRRGARRTMASQAYADRRRGEIDARARQDLRSGGRPRQPGHTTHVSVIDRRGNAVAVTCTIEQVFGSAVVAPGTGFLLNNQLTDFDGPGTANEPRTEQAPALVDDADDRGPPQDAAAGRRGRGWPLDHHGNGAGCDERRRLRPRPGPRCRRERIDARGICGGDGLQLCLEDTRIPADVVEQLAARGHEISSLGEYGNVPLVQVAGTDRLTGLRLAAADPRNDPSGSDAADGAAAQSGRR